MNSWKILIVEDEALLAANLVQILSLNGYIVLPPVSTGENALQSVSELHPDLVLMDIELLGPMSGMEVAARIRESFDIPIIYMTAYSDDAQLEQAKLSEPYGYLVKPVETRDLLVTIRMVFYKHAMDRKLRESEARYRIVSDFTADWEYWEGPDGHLLYVSPSCERITGYRPQEFLEQPELIGTILHSDDRSLFEQHHKEVLKDRDLSTIREIEFRILRKEGQWNWIGHTCRNVFEKNGAWLGLRVSNRDIGARKQAEDALRSAKNIFEGMVNGLTDIVGLQKPDHTIVRYNTAGYEALGMTPEQVSGKKCYELIGRKTRCTRCATANALQSKKRETIERWVPEIDRYLECTSNPILDEKGDVSLIIERLHDLTEHKRLEETLRLSEEKFSRIFHASPAAISLSSPSDGRYIDVNDVFLDIVGRRRNEVIGKTGTELGVWVEPLDRERWMEHMRREGRVRGFETRFRVRAGEIRYFLISSETVEVAGEVCFLTFCQDITDRKQMEEGLRESEEKFSRTFHHNSVAMLLSTFEEGHLLDVNAEFLRMMERTRQETLGRTTVELGMWVHPEQCRLILQQVEEQGAVHNIELECRTKSGKVIQLNWSAVNILVDDKPCLLVSAQDITERKRMEIALAESALKYREMSDLLPETLFECDTEGKITYANQSAFQKLGYHPDELAGGLNIYQMIIPQEIERAKQDMASLLAVGRLENGREYTVCRKDGTTFQVLVNMAVARWEGRIVGLRGIVIDISERKRAEQERLKMQEQLMQSQKMEAVGQLVGGIAHDFNNTLGSVIGYAELAMARVAEGDADSEHYLKGIHLAAGRSKDMIKQLLTFCRKQPILEEDFVLTSVIQESLALIRSVLPPDIRLLLSLPDESVIVRGDGMQMQQALLNLCNNAIYAMKGRSGTLGVELEICKISAEEAKQYYGDLAPGRYAKLLVSDNGVGIPNENLGKIFEPFFTTKMLGEGTGLGLAVVYGVVQRHHGRIDVKSIVGQGTTFILFLPFVSISDESPQEDKHVKTMPTGSGEWVLVVDDDVTSGETVVRRLEWLSYRAEICNNAQFALERIRQDSAQYAAVITDQMMPFMKGSELMQRSHKIRADLPFILCTGYTDRLSPEDAAAIGASAYLEKPVTMELLAETLYGVLHRVPEDKHG